MAKAKKPRPGQDQDQDQQMRPIHAHAAAVDIGATLHVPPSAHGLVLVEMLNSHRLLSYRSAELLALHAVVEIVRPELVQVRRLAGGRVSSPAGKERMEFYPDQLTPSAEDAIWSGELLG